MEYPQTDLFEAITKDSKRAAPEDVYGPLSPETWEPRFADIRARLQEHAYWCKRAAFPPLDLARDSDFLLQLIEKEADPASIETTAAHWFGKYQAEAAKRGELIIEAENLRAERDSYAMTNGRKKQAARLIKCECEACGYVVRTAQSWIDDKGAPHCPDHGEMRVAG